MRIRARAAELLKHLIMLLVVVVIVFPVLWMFTTAVQAPQDLFGQGVGLIPRNPTLMNFKAILGRSVFQLAEKHDHRDCGYCGLQDADSNHGRLRVCLFDFAARICCLPS